MANTTNFGWETPDDTDLVKDGALAMRTLGNAIDTSLVDLKGGTTGQVLSKATNADMDFTWTNGGDITEVTAGTGLSGGGTSGAVTLTNTVATTFDAKGDLVVGTGADTFAKLVAGSNGDTLVADSSATTGLRYNPPVGSLAQPVINGAFDVWQRGTSVSIAAGVGGYSVDRWSLQNGANQAMTISRQSTNDSTNLPFVEYCARVQRNSGQTGTTTINFGSSLETTNSIPFAGRTITLSFYARAGANYSASASALGVALSTGTGTDQNFGSYTGFAQPASGTVTLTTTWQRFVISGTVAATVKEMAPVFTFTPTGTAGANDWFEVTGVQIDLGTWTASTAPAFRRSGGTLAGELAAAMRYYYRTDNSVNYNHVGWGLASSATNLQGQIQFPVRMRVAPTSVDFASLAVNCPGAFVNAITALTLTTGSTSRDFAEINITSTGMTARDAYSIITNNTTNGYLAFNAEL